MAALALAPRLRAARPAPINERLTGNLAPVHDPCIIREGGVYHLFTTGQLGETPGPIGWRTSPDLVTWTLKGEVFPELPGWAAEAIPGTKGLWAPDIIRMNDLYYLYYSVSTFGKNRSAIGLATTPSLASASPGRGWTDRGIVWRSNVTDDYNAIDPNILIDRDDRCWMSFGSFWTGLKIVALDRATGKPPAGATLTSIARRAAPGKIEAPFIIERDGWYYLFASFENCCRGAASTYYTVVGRAKSPTGPYVDREGTPMMEGGGTRVLHADMDKSGRFVGPGHIAILRDRGSYSIVYHAYDARADGAPTLRIQPLGWSGDGWPVAR